ncbi:MAG: methyltransferase domain-containing protein [Coriobacteriales bacterium]|nr:methyltransferase domain-containing protein [Coriobacteriales bacterium]
MARKQMAEVGAATLSQSQRRIREHYGAVAGNAEALDNSQIHHYSRSEQQRLPYSACSVSRGCGNPLSRAALKPGERVLDLGCGGGIDVLLAAEQVGRSGCIYGLDMTSEMLELARRNAAQAGVKNVSFIQGLIEDIPLANGAVDVVISNCVINLSDEKASVLREAWRVLAPGGRFVVADVVLVRPELPPAMRTAAAIILGCTNGVLTVGEYEALMTEIGFEGVLVEAHHSTPWQRLEDKAKRQGQNDLLADLDPQLAHEALAAAYIFGEKP